MVGGSAYCYDPNGNLTDDGVSVYLYDTENRLVEKRLRVLAAGVCPGAASGYTGTLQAALRYDPMGRLYEVIGPVPTNAVTRFLYDGDALVGEYDSTNTLLRRYVHGADSAADDPIAWYEGAAFTQAAERLMRPDWQGSIAIIADSPGTTVLAINRYDEYGIPQATNQGRFQYTGQAWIAELEMYYYKARIYSPTLGRFMQTDPIGYKDQVNLYAYVGNDPVNAVDPDGKSVKRYCINLFIGILCIITDKERKDPPQLPPKPRPQIEGKPPPTPQPRPGPPPPRPLPPAPQVTVEPLPPPPPVTPPPPLVTPAPPPPTPVTPAPPPPPPVPKIKFKF